MPRACTVCAHPERAAIDRAMVADEAFRHIASRFGTSTTALQRHKSDHLPLRLVQARDAREVTQADSLLDRLLDLGRQTSEFLDEARRAKDHALALKAITRAERQLELQARLLGELQDGQAVNILLASPEWLTLRTGILRALQPYPDARLAVAEALGVAR